MTEHEQDLIKWAKRRKRVLAMREKGKDGKYKLTMRQIAEIVGVSTERIRQILQREKTNGKEH